MRWLLAALCSVFFTACAVEVNESTFVDWVGEEAIMLDPSNWPVTPAADLSFLDEVVDAADVVFLGEPDHYINEKYDYRLVIIRYLIGRGYRYIGMEMGVSDGLRVDQYLSSGDGRVLDTVAVYGNREEMRTDRNDLLELFAPLEDGPLIDAFTTAERRFLESLHRLNLELDEPLHWFGFDIDVYPGGAYLDVAAMLEPFGRDPVVIEFLSVLEQVPDESRSEEVARLEGLLEGHLASLEESVGSDLAGAVERSLGCLIDSLRFVDLVSREPLAETWMEGIRYRETALVERLDTNAWPVPPGEKTVLLAHNFHLNRDGSGLRPVAVEEDWPSLGYQSLGAAVAARFDTVALWMLYSRGMSADSLRPDPYFEVPEDTGRLEHLLAQAGTVFILPVAGDDERSTYLERDLNFVSNGTTASGVLADQTDYIFYVEEVTAVGR